MIRFSSYIKYISLTFFLWIFAVVGTYAQKKSGDILVSATYETSVKETGRTILGHIIKSGGSRYVYGLNDAIVVLVQNGDTVKYVATGSDGKCVFKKVPYGKYHISISYVGYNTFEADIEHYQGKSSVEAPMKEGGFILEAVKVKGNIPLTIFRGDTVVVNPLAVETKQGAAAIEIIKQVPGIEITGNGSIKAFGKTLQRSYVGGSSLFGSDVLAALQGVDAELVKNIKFYDEHEYVATINGKRITKEVRVMNIETTRELLSSANGHLLAGIGRDIKEGGVGEKERYKGGVSFNMYNKELVINANLYKNNVGLNSNKADYLSNLMSRRVSGEKQMGAVELGLERKKGEWKDTIYSNLKLNYKYSDESTKSEKREERKYYDTQDYNGREYSSFTEGDEEHSGHNFRVSYSKTNKARNLRSYSLGHSMAFSDRTNFSSLWQKEVNGLLGITLEDINSSKVEDWSVTEDISANFKNPELSLGGSFTMGESNGTGLRSVKETGNERIYEFTPEGRYVKVQGTAFMRMYRWTDEKFTGALLLRFISSYDKERRREFRYDMGDITRFDSLNSYFYSTNNLENTILFYISHHRNGKSNGYRNGISANLGLKQIIINDNDKLYLTGQRKQYYTPTADISYGHNLVNIFYRLSARVPSLEQLRGRVDDSNPLYLRVGNPNLKLGYNHDIYLRYTSDNPFRAVSYFEVLIDGKLLQNPVVPYSEYYPQGGEMADYGNYPVLQGATVQSFKNAKDEYSAKLAVSYNDRISGIKTKVSVYALGDYTRNYSYVQGKENSTDRYTASVRLKSETSYKWMTLSLTSKTEYVYSRNSIRASYKYFNQRVGATADVTLLKHWYVNSSYNLYFNKPVGGTSGVINRDNILNIATGVNLMKSRLKIGFSVFDVFNSSSSFKTMQYADYVQNTWTSMFGRYWSFDIFFNLRKHKFAR